MLATSVVMLRLIGLLCRGHRAVAPENDERRQLCEIAVRQQQSAERIAGT